MKGPLIFLVAGLILQSAAGATSLKCPNNSVSESDLAGGELLLNDTDIVKIRIIDQQKAAVEAKTRSYFSPSPRLTSSYHLVSQPGWRWVVALSVGLYGNGIKDAETNFINHAPVNASYYPSAHKVVVSHISPNLPTTRVSSFWVFLHIPQDTKTVVFDCGSFK